MIKSQIVKVMRMKESIYKAYKDRKYIGDFTSVELHKMIGINQRTLYAYAVNNFPYKKIYKFEKKITLSDMTNEELCAEWDRVRKMLNPEAV